MSNYTKDITLVIGDAHVDAKQASTKRGLRRFEHLNQYILDTMPNRIVIIGDFVTLDSLSAWDRDKRKKMELRRYFKDIEAGNKALDLMLANVPRDIELVYIMGNHEDRLDRYLDKDPTFDGAVDLVTDLDLVGRGFTRIIDYKKYYTHKGVGFTHVPIMENGKGVSGKYATSRALDCTDFSVVFGHTHKLDTACVHRHGAKHLQQALNVGCFFEHIDEYAVGSVTSYWRGIVELDHYSYGRVDITTTSIGKLQRMYK